MDDRSLTNWNIMKYSRNLQLETNDEIAREAAMTVMLEEEQYATIVCSPVSLEEMVIGFLATEGLIRTTRDIKQLQIDEERGFAYVTLYYTPTLTNNQERWIGSCCGKSREFYLKQDVKTAKTIMTETSIALDNVYELMKQFEETAETRNRTGGVHQAAIATEEEMLAAFIDIGRHNALDKLYGYLLKEKTSLKNKIILFSGRVSSEIVLKVSKIGVGMIIAKSAPTDLALKLADDLNVSVIGFAKEASFNVYTNQTSVYEAEKNNHHPHNNIEESR